MQILRSLGLMFLAALSMIGQLPRLLTPGVGLTPQRKRMFTDRFVDATSTLKANLMRTHAGGTIFRRLTSPFPRSGLMVG